MDSDPQFSVGQRITYDGGHTGIITQIYGVPGTWAYLVKSDANGEFIERFGGELHPLSKETSLPS